jgi:mannosyltransferase OCH1-like enzyme
MIPRTIHQIYGLCPKDANKSIPSDLLAYSETWKVKNPTWKHKLWDRRQIEILMNDAPLLWKDTFYALEHWVEQCDFARYYILYVYGGVYADMDTVCQVPAEFFTSNIESDTLIVGVEADVSEAQKEFNNLARTYQLCQWTFAATPRHKGLKDLLDKISLETSKSCFEKRAILNRTGPGVFTDVLINRQDVNVLSISAFGCGQPHSQSPKPTEKECYVVHKFEGSWKVSSWLRPVQKILKKLL